MECRYVNVYFFGDQIVAKSYNVFAYVVGSSIVVGFMRVCGA